MNCQWRLLSAAWLSFAVFCRAQPVSPAAGETDISAAVKSPETLARFVESHRSIDWKSLRNKLALKESQFWLGPCGSDTSPATESPCSTETATVLNPDQAIVIIRGGALSYTVEYLRYLKDPKVGWKCAAWQQALPRDFERPFPDRRSHSGSP
jgi:hypothetical protein